MTHVTAATWVVVQAPLERMQLTPVEAKPFRVKTRAGSPPH
ncbi:hypothetical protein PA10_00263 [Pseudomonas phage pPa_SNUABM_DT01]|nr:hypothetical protein PA10_00263 [Pseudomonas phage pPa_SNUABM_DT01]